MKLLHTLLFLFCCFTVKAQITLSGKVLDNKGNPIVGASVYLDNTLDGSSTDSSGKFRFTTSEKGTQTIVATAVGFSNAGMPLTLLGDKADINLTLKSTAKTLEEVTITAGAFEASNDKDKTVLKPLDIVTTAGSQADVIKAIETLPGTQKQGTQNGLFVRGGDASEAAFVVDGMVVQNAFFSGPPGVATRSRFNAFQFKGVSFSSGGYSARYGQALSSVLELNTLDLPEKSTINLGVNMAGVYASGSKLWKKSGGDVTGFYNNLQPFYGLAKTNFDYYNVPKGYGGSARYAFQPNKNALVKALVSINHFASGIGIPNPGVPGTTIRYGLQNDNYSGQASYKQTLKNKWLIFAAGAISYNHDQSTFDTIPGSLTEQRAQGRLEAKYIITNRLNVLLGSDFQHFTVNNRFDTFTRSINESIISGYAEAEWVPVYWLAFKPGLRFEHSALLQENNLAPRLALAIKTGKNAQVSLASGIFYQNPDYLYLYTVAPYHQQLGFQRAIHYIANYQWQKNDRTFRIEGYYKDYSSLMREHYTNPDSVAYDPNSFRTLSQNLQNTRFVLDNSGFGYATGAEIFWRDKKSIKNADYWISYSYINTQRLFRNYLSEAMPDFVATHNLNIVAKYFIEKLQTQINATYSFASGRPYYNPSNPTFLGDRTPDYQNLAFTINYLRSIKKWFTVIYAGVDNVTNNKNIFGYRYATDGTRFPMVPALYRSFFVGINMSLSQFDKDEL
ncbi:MAG: TonB-dependent receptor [Bacteroidetes bacterium]|nr:TonB-dependent receptor [Bacteroidota bacterium]MBS1738985.1 TonB-dependent receptor [Bacteroidota bacterium]